MKQLISESEQLEEIHDFEEKNKWLYHVLNKNVEGAAITPLTKLPTDEQNTIISDGRAAWIALCRWYKGPIAR